MTIEEMVTVFTYLPDAKKRALMTHEFGTVDTVFVSSTPSIYRDILSIIERHIDLPTFGRLKRVCRDFNRYLENYHELVEIRNYYSYGIIHIDYIMPSMERMFPACAKRLQYLLEQALGTEVRVENMTSVCMRALQMHSRFAWWHIWYGNTVQVKYPMGLICKEPKKPMDHIFQEDPLQCFDLTKGYLNTRNVRNMTSEQRAIREKLIKMI